MLYLYYKIIIIIYEKHIRYVPGMFFICSNYFNMVFGERICFVCEKKLHGITLTLKIN